MAEAEKREINDPDAMALATATPDGRPSVRMVLMRRHGPEGFGFFTNLQSRKGQEIAANGFGALCIHWTGQRRGRRRLFRQPIAQQPDRLLGQRPVTPARSSRDLRPPRRGDAGAVR
jgi:hypothetical protein